MQFFSKTTTVFLSVFQTRSFSRSARLLGITQSAVSQQIAQLEKQLAIELFDRTTRPLTPTREAEVLNEKLSKQSLEMQSLVCDIQSKNYIHPIIRVGLVESIGRADGSEFVRYMLGKGCRLRLQIATSDTLYERLLLDELDVIVATSHLKDNEKLDQRFLFSEPHVIVLPKEIAARRRQWQWEDLKYCGIPLIPYTTNTGSGLQAEMLLAQAHLDLPTRFAIDDNQIIFSLVEEGFGWSLTQPLALLQVLPELKNCTILPAPEPCSHRELLLIRKKTTPVYYIDAVGEAIRHCLIDNIIPVIKKTMPWTKSLLSVADAQFTSRVPA
jgi:DNA-binding transcriptional LysR family regulator